MKPLKIFLIILGIALFLLLGEIVIGRAIVDPKWGWGVTFIIIGIYVFIGMAVGLILLIRKVMKKKPEEIKVIMKEAEGYARNKLLYDDDNPDNFIKTDDPICRVGEAGASATDRTPILWLIGSGSEKKQKIDMLVNLKNPKEEIIILRDKKEEFVRIVIEQFAENPKEIIETEVIPGLDDFGRPQNRVVTRKVSSSQKKEEEKKEDAKVGNAY
jgi:hypothetical protein